MLDTSIHKTQDELKKIKTKTKQKAHKKKRKKEHQQKKQKQHTIDSNHIIIFEYTPRKVINAYI